MNLILGLTDGSGKLSIFRACSIFAQGGGTLGRINFYYKGFLKDEVIRIPNEALSDVEQFRQVTKQTNI